MTHLTSLTTFLRMLVVTLITAITTSCEPASHPTTAPSDSPATKSDSPVEAINHSVVRVNATLQPWSHLRPWEKEDALTRGGLGAVLEDGLVVTVAEMVADSIYIELSDAQGLQRVPAEVVSIDYGANLALLKAVDTGKETFISDLEPLTISDPLAIGAKIDIVQLESTGEEIVSQGVLQRFDVTSTLVDGEYLLTYHFKASLQSATDSFTVPTFSDGQLAGLLYTYESDDQICTIIPGETLRRFLADANDGTYLGFPSAGIAAYTLDDKHFRAYLGLEDDQQGLYISAVKEGGAAEAAGIVKGDVLLGIDDHTIDALGYYDDPHYGRLNWTHIVRGQARPGDVLNFHIVRDGKRQSIELTLTSDSEGDELIAKHSFDHAPAFYIKGGMIFQELSLPFMQRFGNEWASKAPLELLQIINDPTSYEPDVDRVVILSAVIPTPATVGYEGFRNEIVTEVNGRPIGSIDDLDAAFSILGTSVHTVGIDTKPDTIYVDAQLANMIDQQLLERGIPRLKRLPQEKE